MKIEYEVEYEFYPCTPCPFGKVDSDGYPIMVGSNECALCEHFVWGVDEKNYVECEGGKL